MKIAAFLVYVATKPHSERDPKQIEDPKVETTIGQIIFPELGGLIDLWFYICLRTSEKDRPGKHPLFMSIKAPGDTEPEIAPVGQIEVYAHNSVSHTTLPFHLIAHSYGSWEISVSTDDDGPSAEWELLILPAPPTSPQAGSS